MKRASYREAVRWIAENDETGSSDALYEEVVSLYVTTLLVADLFRVDPAKVAKDIVSYRTKSMGNEVVRG